MPSNQPAPPPEPMPRGEALFLVIYNVVFLVGPVIVVGHEMSDTALTVEPPVGQVVWWAAVMGALGGCVHGLSSLGVHAGDGSLERPWLTFYLARPFLGAGMGVATALVLVSGLAGFAVKGGVTLLAWAALAGLFSQPALDKLKEIFDTLFLTKAKAKDA